MAQRFAWTAERVFFAEPQTQQIRSLPLAWTSLALLDAFLGLAAKHTMLPLQDVQQLLRQ